MTRATPEALAQMAGHLCDHLDAMPMRSYNALGWDAWRKACDADNAALRDVLAALGFRVRDVPAQGCRVTFGGVSSGSTGGLAPACRNWIVTAQRKAAIDA